MKRLKKILMDQETDMARSPRFIGSHKYTPEVHRRWQAALWVGCSYDEIDPVSEWHGGVLDMVGELRNLLLPIVALQVYGSVAEITAKIDTVINTIKIVRDFNDLKANSPERKQTISELEKISADLEKLRPQMDGAERILAAKGWKYDSDVKKIRELPSGERGKPGGFLARCCVAVYMDRYDGRKLTAEVLQGIKKHLSEIFPEEYLDASPKGPIYWAVKNRKVGPHNRKRSKTPKL